MRYNVLYVMTIFTGIDSEDEAIQHWIDDGCAEGRQATSRFHSKQYLELWVTISQIAE